MPLVSIIVPNYNHFNFLKERLDSIFNQTFQDFEVLLLDDASTDHSVSILETHKNHTKVGCFEVNEINSGIPFVQWKKGIEKAKGTYVWLAESDDLNDYAFLAELVPIMEKDKTIGIAFSGIEKMSSNDSEVYRPIEEPNLEGKRALREHMITGNLIINASGAIFRRSLVETKVLDAITQYRICGDWYLWSSILSKSNVAFVDKPLTSYRQHDGASTNNLFVNPLFYSEGISVSKKVLQYLGNRPKDLHFGYCKWEKSIINSELSTAEKSQLSNHLKQVYQHNKKIYRLKKRIVHKMTIIGEKLIGSIKANKNE